MSANQSDPHPPASIQLLYEVADATGVDPADIEYQWQEHIDLGAIDTLADHDSSTWKLSFELPDRTVCMWKDTDISVETAPNATSHTDGPTTEPQIPDACPHCTQEFTRDVGEDEHVGYVLVEEGTELALIRCVNCASEFPVPE